MRADAVLAKLDAVKSVSENVWQARCPAHPDKDPSLTVTARPDRILLHCHAGCDFHAIIEAIGLKAQDLFDDAGKPSPAAGPGKLVKTYDYTDLNGKLIYQVCRYEPKTFRQRRPNGFGGWVWSMDGVNRVLYRLPEVAAAAVAGGRLIFIVEGEKDADALAALGLIATTNPGGAGKWKPDYNDSLNGVAVCVIPDADTPGREHAAQVAAALQGKAASVKVLALPGPGKDAADWITGGGTRDALEQLADAAPAWTPKAPETPVAASNVIHLAPPLEQAISAALPLPAVDINAFPASDSGNGELFALLYQNRVKHQKRGADRIFDGHVWREPRDGELDQLAKQLARHRALAACMAPDQNHRRALTNWAIKSEHQAGKNNTLAAARATPPIADDDQPWDADHNLLGTVNGIVNLRTSELRPGKPEDKITRAVTVPFDPAISCPRWTRFLDEVFEGDNALIDFIQTAVGYSLTGFTKEQCLFIMLGRGGNGKGTFVNVLEHIMGPYVTVTGSATFETSTRSGAGGATPELAALEGARIVFAQEINERAHMDEGRIKRMTGSDTITARKLYQAEYTFTPTFKIWFAVNHPPIVRDATHGFWRRVRLVPFNRIFDPHQEPNLESTLKAEAAGILAWAVRGAAEWYRSGLISPPSVLVATKDYRDDQEILSEWMNSEIIVNPQMQTPTSEAYANYLAWAEKTKLDERERLSRSWFSRRLSQKFDHKRTNLGVIFFGFGIQGTLIM